MTEYDCIDCEYNYGEGLCNWWDKSIAEVDECEEVKIDG